MTNGTNWNKLMEDHEIACLRGDLATSSPESYTIDEMKAISEGMDASTRAVEAAMREDFASLPPHAQARMLDLLAASDPANREWWVELLTRARPEPGGFPQRQKDNMRLGP